VSEYQSEYQTDEQQAEAIKKWLKDNGLSVAMGIALGFALLFAWRWWLSYTQKQEESTSTLYEQVLIAMDKGETEKTLEFANILLTKHTNTAYAVLTALNLAQSDLKQGNIPSSHARLDWVIKQNYSPEFTHIARLRKAQLFLSENKINESKQLITGVEESTFKASYAALKGDIAVAEGQMETARIAYQESLNGELSPDYKNLVEMKLHDLGVNEGIRVVAMPPKPEMGNPNTNQVQMNIPVPESAFATPITTDSTNDPLINIFPFLNEELEE
jgi:predicted negative regulator of RcsB-dependent stress response